MGDVLRMYVTGEQRERMLKGELLSDDEVTAIIDKVLKTISNGEEIILDGYPRTIPQAEWLLEQAKAGRFNLDKAFHLVASREAVKQRLLGRARVDDQDAAIEKRFDEYERATAPLLDWLKQNGVQVIDINAERSVEDVNKDIDSYLD
jgi:adenylate kinase